MERRKVYAWVTVHAPECEWTVTRGQCECDCGAEHEMIETEHDCPTLADDRRGFMRATRRAVLTAALETMKGVD